MTSVHGTGLNLGCLLGGALMASSPLALQMLRHRACDIRRMVHAVLGMQRGDGWLVAQFGALVVCT